MLAFDVRQYLDSLTRFGMKPGLLRVSKLLERLDNPHLRYMTLHVGGTNGKGSVSATLASILREAGYRTGLFTSPHLVRYNERFQIDGVPIDDDVLSDVAQEVAAAAVAVSEETGGDPTEFEIGTAIAFTYFQRARVDIAVIEVGLGGRLDSTNVIVPEAVAITPVSLDHTNILGDDITAIASEKAGIFKKGKPIVLAPQQAAARQHLIEAAQRVGAPVVAVVDEDLAVEYSDTSARQGATFKGTQSLRTASVTPVATTAEGGHFHLRTPFGTFENMHTPLLGRHQIDNAATAVTLVAQLREKGVIQCDDNVIRLGLQRTTWAGRLDLRPGTPRLLFDGVHNFNGAQALAQALTDLFPNERIVFLLGIMGGKDVDGILQTLLPLGRGVVFTQPAVSRIPATEPLQLEKRARELLPRLFVSPSVSNISRPLDDVAVANSAAKGLATAQHMAGPDGIVCVAGSLYLVGEVMGLTRGK